MRKPTIVILVMSALLLVSWIRPPGAVSDTFIFPLSFHGKAYRTFPLTPGEKAPAHSVDDKKIAPIVQGFNLFDFSSDKVRTDPGGRYHLYYDGKTSWRVATNTNGVATDTLTGQVANKGTFWMVGKYNVPVLGPVADVFVTGTVKFNKGTFDPKSIKGTMYLVSSPITTGLILKFKTLGNPIVVPPLVQ